MSVIEPIDGLTPLGRRLVMDPARLAHACLAACLLLVAWPVLVTAHLPIFDFPNHLARIHVMATFDQGKGFAAHFEPTGYLIPNVLADLVMLALYPLLGAMGAGKTLLLATLALTITGAYALNRVVAGSYSVWPLFVAMLVFNEPFFWGFLNYNLGLALLLWALTAWLAWDHRRQWQLASGVLFALLIFFAHLVAFGLFAFAIAVIELRRVAFRWPGLGGAAGRLAASAAIFVPSLLIFWGASPSGGLDLSTEFDFSLFGKVMPFTRLLSSNNTGLDVFSLTALCLVLAAGLVLRHARCHPLPLRLAGVYLALELCLPYTAMGSYFLDSRIVVPIAILLAASFMPRRSAGSMGVAAVLIGLTAVRSTGLVLDWAEQDRDYARVVKALDRVPAHSVVVTAVGHGFELGDWTTTRRIKPAHEHTTLYATISHDVIVPNIFARRGQNPLVFQSSFEPLNRVARNPVPRVFAEQDARWLIGQVQPIAEQRLQASPPIPAVFIMGYRVPCAMWPTDLPIRAVRCEKDFSLIQVTSGTEISQAMLNTVQGTLR